MNTNHMQYFVDAVRAGSLKRSAELNFVTHSAVSLAIRALEKELGTELLVHSKRKFEPTPEGLNAKEQFEAWLKNLSELKGSLTTTSKIPSGELRIVTAQSLMIHYMSDTIARFRELYPQVKVHLLPGASRTAHQAVVRGEADLAILVDNHALSDCDSKTLAKGKFVLVRKPSSKKRVEGGVIVTSMGKVEVDFLARQWRKYKKIELPVEMEVMSWTLIKSLVLTSSFIGYMPEYMVRDEIDSKKLSLVGTSLPAFDYEIKAAWRHGRALHRNAQLFLNLL